MRRELTVKAEEVRQEIVTRADEIAAKAKDAEWVPIFQRDAEDATNGQPGDAADAVAEAATDATASVQEATSEAGSITDEVAEVAEQAADDTAEAISDSYDAVDRESRP